MKHCLSIWKIYKKRSNQYAVRELRVTPDCKIIPQKTMQLADTLEGARACVPPGHIRLPRVASDEAQVVESWA